MCDIIERKSFTKSHSLITNKGDLCRSREICHLTGEVNAKKKLHVLFISL